MFWEDIRLVTNAVNKYGLRSPACDAGGLKGDAVTIADYDLTIASGDQHRRYVKLKQNPFAHLFGDYEIFNPDYGHAPIERLDTGPVFGTVVCLSVLEHVEDPLEVFKGLYRITKDGGLVILSTEFSFPYHPSPADNFRFSPNGLRILASRTSFKVLECDWGLNINADMGIKEIHTGVSQEIISTYIVMSKGELSKGKESKVGLPKRYDKDGAEI